MALDSYSINELSKAASGVQEPGCLSSLEARLTELLKRGEDLASGLAAGADRVCGSQPTADNSRAALRDAAGGGAVQNLIGLCDQLSRAMDRIGHSVSRLNNTLS